MVGYLNASRIERTNTSDDEPSEPKESSSDYSELSDDETIVDGNKSDSESDSESGPVILVLS
jgi:hypothetical protein